MWPEIVQLSEIQPRLVGDGVPLGRAQQVASEVSQLKHGDRYKIERTQGDLFLYAQGAGWYRTADR